MKPLIWMLVIVLWFFPVLICLLAIWRWRGGWRLAPLIPLVIMAPLLAIDVKSAVYGGNLTGIMTMLAYTFSLPVLLLIAVIQSYVTRHQQRHSVAASYTMAAVSSVFIFAGVLFLWWLVTFFFPDDFQLGPIGAILYWIVGSLLALLATAFSFRSTVRLQTRGQGD